MRKTQSRIASGSLALFCGYQFQMNILVISGIPPNSAGNGGEIRTWHLLRTVANHSTVSLFGCCSDAAIKINATQVGDVMDTPPTRQLKPKSLPVRLVTAVIRTIRTLALPHVNDWSNYLNLVERARRDMSSQQCKGLRVAFCMIVSAHFIVLSHFAAIPPFAVHFVTAAFRKIRLPDNFDGSQIDAVWVEGTPAWLRGMQVAQEVGVPASTPVILSAQNVEWLISSRLSMHEQTWWKRQFLRSDARIYRRFEHRVHSLAAAVIHCSEDDRQLALKLAPSANVCVVPNGVDIEYYKGSNQGCSEVPTLFYTGSYTYRPNLEAANELVKHVLPEVRRLVGRVRLILAGRNATVLNNLAADDDDIVIVDSPEDIRPVFREGWIMPVTLKSGGGTRLKILEAMSMKRTVVSTAVGAEGLPVTDGDQLLIREIEQMPEALAELIRDQQQRDRLAENAHQWVSNTMSWNACTEPVPKLLQQLINSDPQIN